MMAQFRDVWVDVPVIGKLSDARQLFWARREFYWRLFEYLNGFSADLAPRFVSVRPPMPK
jgi:hypothetical protein